MLLLQILLLAVGEGVEGFGDSDSIYPAASIGVDEDQGSSSRTSGYKVVGSVCVEESDDASSVPLKKQKTC